MKDTFYQHLFSKHVLVGNKDIPSDQAFCSVIALAKRFGIRVTTGFELACEESIREAALSLGEYVPEPFYRGFPNTVKELTNEQLLFDQLYHYTQTYGLGWFEQAGHSVIESVFNRLAFKESTTPKDFRILSEEDCAELIKEDIRNLLKTNRPLNVDNKALVLEGWIEYGKDIIPDEIPCKNSVITLLYNTKNVDFFERYLQLPDTIKLLEYIQYEVYGSNNLKKLNLRNQDRKLIKNLLDKIFCRMSFKSYDDMVKCLEKKQIWCGLLHHIHYKPKNGQASAFINEIRGKYNNSVWSIFERNIREGDCVVAAKTLIRYKGTGALIRNLNYILSRCKTKEEIQEVLECLKK